MSRKGQRRRRIIPIVFLVFVAGAAIGWWGRAEFTRASIAGIDIPLPTATTGDVHSTSSSPVREALPTTAGGVEPSIGAPRDAPSVLAAKHLRLPIDNADVQAMKGQFGERRAGGARGHEAVDILAPRNTPVHAVEDGTIAKLFTSKQGGLTVYQFDPSGRFCYYYAHLERYAPDLREQQSILRGDVIGYVGTSGNAPANTPHLHFAIFELTPERHWWQGTPIDPWPAFKG
jgi:peptidoglycan LD-endopeptidase LytH